MAQQAITQKWLATQVGRYQEKNEVYEHIDAVLEAFPTLRPKADVYTYDDGRVKTLLCVHGLLPIKYRGATYNIPIACWIPPEYPKQPPMTYVVPTSDMLVRSGKNLDISGLCKFQYLQNWEIEWKSAALVPLVRVMAEIFSQEPPVYSKPRAPATSLKSELPATSQTISPPPPPRPHTGDPSLSEPPYGTPSESISPPRPPPKPLSISAPVTHSTIPSPSIPTSPDRTISQPTLQASPPPPHLPLPITRPPLSAASPPSYVGVHPPEVHSPPFPQTYPENRPPFTIYSSTSPPPPPPPPPIVAHSPQSSGAHRPLGHQPPPVPGEEYGQYSHQAHPTSVHYNTPPLSGFQSPVSLSQTSVPSPPQQVSTSNIQPPSHRTPAPDLMSQDDSDITPSNRNKEGSPAIPPDISVPAPPRPLNPQILNLHNQLHAKISAELMRVTRTLSEDSERLRTTQTHLLNGEPAIRDEMARLEAVRDVCRTVARRTKAFVDEAETRLSEAKRRGEPEVDELVCATSIVGNQLIDLVADDNAIEDTLYHLHRALNAGRIDLERYIKFTRELAGEQFMKRALIEKIEGSVPLGISRGWS